jgi:hypothetical protein
MAKIKSKEKMMPANKEEALSVYEQKKKRNEKIKLWLFIIWILSFMVIMAKYGKFGNLWNG